MVNVDRLRELNIAPDAYLQFISKWRATVDSNYLYCGDQCFVSAFFLTEIQSTYYPKTHGFSIIKNIRDISNSNSYNNIKAVHFVSLFNNIKPWHISETVLDKIPSFEYVLYHRNIWKAFTHASIELFHLWWDYCKQTPTYNEIVSNIDDFKLISGLIVQIETCVKSIKIYEDSISARK